MTPIKTTILNIVPSTNVRSTQGDRWLFAVSDEYLAEYDLKKLESSGKKGGNERRKRQLEKYNYFKEEVFFLAEKQGFVLPKGYFALWFYVPIPKSWRKKKIDQLLYAPHQNMPDWDNFAKAVQDGIMPRKSRTKGEKGRDDRSIHCLAVFKVWVMPEEACIKIVEYDSNEFNEAFKHGHPSYS